jgi:hypothetical protein
MSKSKIALIAAFAGMSIASPGIRPKPRYLRKCAAIPLRRRDAGMGVVVRARARFRR